MLHPTDQLPIFLRAVGRTTPPPRRRATKSASSGPPMFRVREADLHLELLSSQLSEAWIRRLRIPFVVHARAQVPTVRSPAMMCRGRWCLLLSRQHAPMPATATPYAPTTSKTAPRATCAASRFWATARSQEPLEPRQVSLRSASKLLTRPPASAPAVRSGLRAYQPFHVLTTNELHICYTRRTQMPPVQRCSTTTRCLGTIT